MVAPLCKHDCYSPHLGQFRQHLPLCLIRATHSGTADGSVPQTPNFSTDMTLWPRYRFRRNITRGEIDSHLDKKAHYETQFSSVATWSLLSSRIDTWKKQGVRDLRVHVIFSPFLPQDTEVYRVTGLVERYSLHKKPYYEGEYLIRGPIHSSAIVWSFLAEGRDVLIEIPLFGYQNPFSPIHRDSVLMALPAGFFTSGDNPDVSEYEIVDLVRRRAGGLYAEGG
ncbi:hypothetical protein BDV40DRAFT_115204 [Aspergillus tamarii]|uniref:Uncharacterized protein n=1 Tax=Aspergillus tamarii TaxID=41984 RepID=A0A5N6UAH5_ASPTM|nr:hypothetical protein BDV40DRAFT_115204 [Aspergillus tamarii]